MLILFGEWGSYDPLEEETFSGNTKGGMLLLSFSSSPNHGANGGVPA